MTGVTRGGFTVVLPVKTLAAAKSRLGGTAPARAALALAMATDVANAARQVGEVLVVTDDPTVAATVGAGWVEPDLPRAGLSAAAAYGATAATRRRPNAGVAVLAADLPALTAAALTAALAAVLMVDGGAGCGVVADAAGVGTVLLAAVAGAPLSPAFEGGSFARHRAGGAADLTPYAADGLRRDVDTLADLAATLAIGVGPATAAAVAAYPEVWRVAGLVVHPGL